MAGRNKVVIKKWYLSGNGSAQAHHPVYKNTFLSIALIQISGFNKYKNHLIVKFKV